MAAPKIGYDVPNDPIVGPNGQLSHSWWQYFDRLSNVATKVREGADLMDDLDPVTATTNEIATAWEELRVKLQEIV